MRQIMNSAANPTSNGKSLPAPIGGWNARDPIADMPSRDAVFMDNFFPRTTDIRLRKGCTSFASVPNDTEPATPHNVRALLSYSPTSGVKKLFAADNTGIYDITAGGAVAAISSAATNAEWQSLNVTTAGGSFLWCCNGVDKARYFNGTAWTLLDLVSTPALTGLASIDVINISLFKTRIILTCKNSLSFWYLPVVAIAGAASEFPLGAIFKKGGYIVGTETWTLDAGTGPDDYFVALTSEGEAAVYRGTDPASAANFALVGVFDIGKPIGRRCFVKFGGDLGILTIKGLYPLSKAMLSASIDRRSTLTDKIDAAFLTYADEFKSLYGWQVLLFSEAPFILINVPILSQHSLNAVYSYQFVMNTMTGAWCRFTNLFAECWVVHDGKLFFACHNKVSQAWTGSDDLDKPIDGRVKTAFQYPFGRGNLGRVTMLRPIITTSASVTLQLGVDTDYDESTLTSSNISYSQNLAKWDTDKWDEAIWSSGTTTVAKWRSVSHTPGRAVSLRLRVLSKGVSMSWNATDLILQRGGML